MSWIFENYVQILRIVAEAVTLFSMVAAVTTTTKDDTVLKYIKDVLARFVSLK